MLALACALVVEGGVTGARPVSGQGAPAPVLVRRIRIEVDEARPARPISPLIYGVSVADSACLAATGARLHRWGGNPNSRHNWEINAWNAARDWEFRNGGAAAGLDPEPSAAADRFVALNREAGIASVVTVPALGWVARDRSNDSRSTGVPAQGGLPAGRSGAIRGYDPAANRAATSLRSLPRAPAPFAERPATADAVVYQDEWVAHLVRRFGGAARGGVPYYVVDNEPDLWAVTHTDVYPAHPGYDALLSVFLDYAAAIKRVDPAAQVLGPALSGWHALFHSPRDRLAPQPLARRAARRLLPRPLEPLLDPDRLAHGGAPFLPWWLEQVRRYDARAGRRSLDALDVHFYPQGPDVFSARDDPGTRALRLRSTRALWDPTYRDESWIGGPVALIPTLRAWIARHYPGTRLAIGEWNWGAERTIGGALAVADVLGIFGREGVDLAAYWTCPPPDSPAARAFALYTNYDGAGSAFGDVSLATTVTVSPATGAGARPPSLADVLSAYAGRDSARGHVMAIVLNKQSAPLEVEVALAGGPVGASGARVYRLGPETPTTIVDLGSFAAHGGALALTLPPFSATLLRFDDPRPA